MLDSGNTVLGKMLSGEMPPWKIAPPRKIFPHKIVCEFFPVSNFYFYGNFRL